jgi:hypothetical protein
MCRLRSLTSGFIEGATPMALFRSRPNNALHAPSQNLQESEEALFKGVLIREFFLFPLVLRAHLAIDPPK